jgi:hypothetical protein
MAAAFYCCCARKVRRHTTMAPLSYIPPWRPCTHPDGPSSGTGISQILRRCLSCLVTIPLCLRSTKRLLLRDGLCACQQIAESDAPVPAATRAPAAATSTAASTAADANRVADETEVRGLAKQLGWTNDVVCRCTPFLTQNRLQNRHDKLGSPRTHAGRCPIRPTRRWRRSRPSILVATSAPCSQ